MGVLTPDLPLPQDGSEDLIDKVKRVPRKQEGRSVNANWLVVI